MLKYSKMMFISMMCLIRNRRGVIIRKSSSLQMDDFDICDLTNPKPLAPVLDQNEDLDEDDFEMINPDEYHVFY
jgi:hypothetical protein